MSTTASKWEKSKFMGTEISGKRLGIIGCRNIGAIVPGAEVEVKVMGYDPFLTDERKSKSWALKKLLMSY